MPDPSGPLECVVNVSEGRDGARIGEIAAAAGAVLLDVHSDVDHNRSVLTLAGTGDAVWAGVTALAAVAVAVLDLRDHVGAHPRIGVIDVVPFVDLDEPRAPATGRSVAMRDRFAEWIEAELGVPAARYGPERSLPEVRRNPPPKRHPSAGAVAVGARGVLVAYNLWLATGDVAVARRVAAAVRGPGLRTLGLDLGGRTQVSCNLIEPYRLGPAGVYDLVAAHAPVERAELVGLLPAAVLMAVDPSRRVQLGIGADRTIEQRLART